MLRKATAQDLKKAMELFGIAKTYMHSHGNPNQWNQEYPTLEIIQEDLAKQRLYVLEDDKGVYAVFVLRFGSEPTYAIIEQGQWLNNEPYVTIHRLASDGKHHGVFKEICDYALTQINNIRVDTHHDNQIMRTAITNYGFQECGQVYVGDGTLRIAYQYVKGD